MIDLHAHTSESDGTFSPAELVNLAGAVGLEALAVTDHDTLSGFDQARPFAREIGLDLVCGIEMSTRYEGRSVHLLGYFLEGDPGPDFRHWILGLQQSRRARNRKLLAKLQANGLLSMSSSTSRRVAMSPGMKRPSPMLSIESAWPAAFPLCPIQGESPATQRRFVKLQRE